MICILVTWVKDNIWGYWVKKYITKRNSPAYFYFLNLVTRASKVAYGACSFFLPNDAGLCKK